MINALYDLTGCTCPDLEVSELVRAMRNTVERLGCTIRGELPVVFQPHGITCTFVLAESHLTVSTWPEFGIAHIDLFTCRADVDPDRAVEPIAIALGASHTQGQRIVRTGPNSSTAAA